jgi:putative chitinase
MLITFKQLDEITATLGAARCIEMSDLLNEICEEYGVTGKLPFQMFLANVIQESGEFSAKQENMNYKAKTLMKVWPKRFPTMQVAMQYEHNPQKLSNFVYGGRMGNTEPNDGWQYRGGGFIGLTGKEIYTKYAKYIGKGVYEAADLVHTQDRYALDSACWFFAVLKKLIPVANGGNFIEVVRGINGGTIGLPTRQHYYDLCKLVLK